METINKVISENIIHCRKQCGLTQAELADKLNYSDKAVSKWERGESLPDISIMLKIANIFGVTVDDLCNEKKPAKVTMKHEQFKRHLIISLIAIGAVWLVATIVFVGLIVFAPNFAYAWMSFIYAIPSMCIVALVCNAMWGNGKFSVLIISALIWTVLLSFTLSFNAVRVYYLYFVGIPLQIMTLLWGILNLHVGKKTKE